MDPRELRFVYDGWDSYQRSLVSAVRELTVEQLAFRSCPEMASVGDLVLHLADGRVDWFRRLNASGSAALWTEVEQRVPDQWSAEKLVDWLERTWAMVAATLEQWTVDDLAVTYEQPYQGTVFAVSRQWVIWRIMAHDIHHGGQLSELLAMQGVFPLELTLLGGHLTEPPVVG